MTDGGPEIGAAVYEKHGDWFVAYIEGLPGVNTQGRTRREAEQNLRDALRIFLETRQALGDTDQPTEV